MTATTNQNQLEAYSSFIVYVACRIIFFTRMKSSIKKKRYIQIHSLRTIMKATPLFQFRFEIIADNDRNQRGN